MNKKEKRTRSSRLLALAAPFLLLLMAQFSATAATGGNGDVCADPLRIAASNLPPAAAAKLPRTLRPETPSASVEGPISDAELKQIMGWIANKVAVARLPFCWKRNEGVRGAGEPLTKNCGPGQENSDGLCYKKCDNGYKGKGPVCSAPCPSGYTDIGVFCQKPEAYGRGVGYVIFDEEKCKRENPQGCEQNAAMFYPKCKQGYRAFGSNICTPECPSGWADTGTGCTKPNYGRGVGTTPICREGLEKNGALCYEKCPNGAVGVGPACWQKCSGDRPTDCAAGCSTNSQVCAGVIFNQVSASLTLATNLISLGTGSGSLAGKVADKFGEVIGFVGNFAGTIDQPGQLKRDDPRLQNVKVLLDRAITDFSGDFAAMTTDEVNSTIDEQFTPEAAQQIKEQWATVQFRLLWKDNGALKKTGNFPPNVIQTMQATLSLVAEVDPTGIAGAASAFSQPICGYDVPFPEVSSGRKR